MKKKNMKNFEIILIHHIKPTIKKRKNLFLFYFMLVTTTKLSCHSNQFEPNNCQHSVPQQNISAICNFHQVLQQRIQTNNISPISNIKLKQTSTNIYNKQLKLQHTLALTARTCNIQQHPKLIYLYTKLILIIFNY